MKILDFNILNQSFLQMNCRSIDFVYSISTSIHELLYRHLINDEEEELN